MTVHGSEADQLRALKAGAIDYLPKPINLRVLMAKLGSWIERSGRRT
jgi:DNA-binding response OmpR family regulator